MKFLTEHWWFRQDDPHALALVRIVFGLFLFFYWALFLPYVPALFSTQGLALPLFVDGFLQTPDAPTAWILFGLPLLSCLLIAIGTLMRTSCIAAILLLTFFQYTSQHNAWFTMERLSLIFLFLLCCSGADYAYSLRMKLKHGRWSAWEPVSILPHRLIALQITATLLGAALVKVVMKDWQSGDIMAYSFIERWATPVGFWIAQQNIPLWMYDIATKALTLFELCLPFGLWTRWRMWWLAGLAVFLVFNALILGFWWFLVLLPASITFWGPKEIAQWLHANHGDRKKNTSY
jgi:hypothetical protein